MRAMRAALLAALLAFCASGGAQTVAEAPRERIPFKQDDGESGALALRMLLALAAIAGLGWAAVAFAKRRGMAGFPTGGGPGLRVVQSTRLGPRAALHVVEFGGQRVLVGQSEGALSVLATESGAAPSVARESA